VTKVVDHGGERVKSVTGAEREAPTGKGRFDLLPALALERLAQHYEAGARKYQVRGWEKGLPLARFVDSAFRHLVQFMKGDRTEDHLAAVLWNVAGYIWTEDAIEKGQLPKELDDVPWPQSTSKRLDPLVVACDRKVSVLLKEPRKARKR
jgi:hypothetical protein